MGPIGCPETSMRNQPTLRNNPEDGRILVNRSGSLRSRIACLVIYLVTQIVNRGVTRVLSNGELEMFCSGSVLALLIYPGIDPGGIFENP